MPEPFLDIASHCLRRRPHGRWTVAQIAAHLEGRTPVPQVSVVPPEVQIPVRAPRPVGQQSRTPASRDKNTVLIAVGSALVLAAIFTGSSLLRHHSAPPQVSSSAEARPVVPPAPRQVVPTPQKEPVKSTRPAVIEKEESSKAIAPTPASIHPVTIHEEEVSGTKLPAGSLVRGEVAHQVSPEVLQSARNSIRGTVRVTVKVNVDRLGDVEDAELESRGPSKYFSQAALEAAQLWKFKPPKVGGRGVLSTWTLHFEFTRDATTVEPIQELP
jgi:TonB family protein